MTAEPRSVRLGFAEGSFPEGTHICQIFSDDQERDAALTAFLLAGLEDGARVACFSEKVHASALQAAMKGQDLDALQADGSLTLAGTRDVYFAEGRFDPDRMLEMLTRFYVDSRKAGRASRVIGEMSPDVCGIAGGDRLMEYECRVSLLLQEKPLTAVCQYEAGAFDGATIMDVLKVHPMMVVRGRVVRNPFFISPTEYLSR
ncbi:MAG: MEDS domain-containing protein [Holophaga sp.]|nr:MEDS domain-containing protein [Holophaga sp.]